MLMYSISQFQLSYPSPTSPGHATSFFVKCMQKVEMGKKMHQKSQENIVLEVVMEYIPFVCRMRKEGGGMSACRLM